MPPRSLTAGRGVVHEADEPEAQLAMGEDRLRDLLAQLAGARHQDAADVVAGRPHPLEIARRAERPPLRASTSRTTNRPMTAWLYSQRRRHVRLELVVDADVEGRPEEESRPDEDAEQDGEELVDRGCGRA